MGLEQNGKATAGTSNERREIDGFPRKLTYLKHIGESSQAQQAWSEDIELGRIDTQLAGHLALSRP